MNVAGVVGPLAEGSGVIGLLSSDEFTPAVEAFDRALLDLTGRRVAIVLAAGPEVAPQSSAMAVAHYERLGAAPTVVDVLRREQAVSEALPDYDVLFLGGGSPPDLLACLSGTPLWEEVVARWSRGAAIAGSSAGAMALCRHCLVPEEGAARPTRWSEGLGPLESFALAVHARTRPREWLEEVSSTAPVPVVALDDAVGMILAPGRGPSVVGTGGAWLA